MAMRNVHLHGELGAKFGGPYRLDVASPAEAAYALAMQMGPQFLKEFGAGSYFIQVASQPVEAMLQAVAPSAGDIEIFPSVLASGEKGKSVGMIIAGTVLLGAAVIASGGSLAPALAAGGAGGLALSAAASIGAGLILGGVTGLLSPTPQMQDLNSPREGGKTQSFLFHGPINREAEGGPVPLVFGRCIIGSIKVAGGTMVTSSISEGVEYIQLDAVPVGSLAFNFDLTNMNLGGSPQERFYWNRRDKSSVSTVWDWEGRVDWTAPGTLPNIKHLRVDIDLFTDDGKEWGLAFNDHFYETHNGNRTSTTRLTLPADRKISHRCRFYIDGGSDDDDIFLTRFYSRLRRVS